jgi:transposase
VSERLAPFVQTLQNLDTIPGIGPRTTEEILAEITLDMDRFPSAKHLASWARVCPGNNQSGGKRKSGSAGKGNNWLRGILIQAAYAAGRAKNTYLSSQYHRIAARRGKKRAALAVAHAILTIVYHLIRDNTTYEDLGANHLDERQQQRTIHRAVRRIGQLGYRVTLEAA